MHNDYIFFCSHEKTKYIKDKWRAVFSQWRYSLFTDDNNITYNSGEQYMMYQKAILMDDTDAAKKILSINIYDETCKNESKVVFRQIAKIKNMGRKIKNFNQKLWDDNKFDIVKKGNYYKFSQNSDLKCILLNTGNSILAEASSYDDIWGIGFSETDANITDPSKYGKNLLGRALMNVRSELS